MGVCTRLLDLEVVAAQVGSTEPAAVIYCNNCVRACGSGGEGRMQEISRTLRQRGVRIEEEILVTNPCCRSFLEEYRPGGAVKVLLAVACDPVAFALRTLHPKLRTVVALETLGLFINSKARNRLKLAMTFPGFEALQDKEFKLGDVTTMYDDQVFPAGKEVSR